jgi:hypothetical protein
LVTNTVSAQQNRTIIAVGPGRSKSGLAVVVGPLPPKVLEHIVVESLQLLTAIQAILERHPDACTIVMGNGTGSGELADIVRKGVNGLDIVLVDEHGTSEQARARFVVTEPLPVWQRLLPTGMRSPNRPYDDYVAIILAEQYFQSAQ